MLSLGKFSPIAIYCRPRALISQYRIFPNSIRFGNGLVCTALKSKKKGDFSFTTAEMEMEMEMDGPDEFEEDSVDEDEEEEEVIIPLQNMKKWMENRPRGFGEGKAYDTSIEDKLMEEIEQSRKAQVANLNKLKDNPTPTKPGTKKQTDKQDKGSAKDETGIRVRLTNLPKKKNIHRDLRLAFNRVPGILDLAPVVSGNEKTRDPVCKGLAFVSFNNPDQAHKFVQEFSGTNVSFGKVEKRINCELVNPNLPKPASDEVVPSPQSDEDSNNDNDDSDQVEPEVEVERQKKEPPRMNDKKTEAKRRKATVPKLKTITGSAKRLKMREKSVLTGVLTKYGTSDGGIKSSR